MIVFIFIFGLLVGSFLNVVLFRMNTGLGISGRSGCFSCGKQLRWYELIPVLSFVVQSGKCKTCKSKISRQYPIVELLTGFIFTVSFLRINPNVFDIFSWVYVLLTWIVSSVLIVIFVYDMKYKVIPLWTSIMFAVTSLLIIGVRSVIGESVIISSILGMILLTLFLGSLWFFSKGKWMGFGDVEFAIGMGLYLGVAYGLSGLALAFWIGAAYALFVILIQKISMGTSHLRHVSKRITMKSEIPFAPFLVIGTLLSWFFEIDIFHLTLFFS